MEANTNNELFFTTFRSPLFTFLLNDRLKMFSTNIVTSPVCISDSSVRTQTSVLLPWKNGREWRHKRGRRQTCLLARSLSALPRAARGHSRPRRFYPSRWRHVGPWIDPYFSGSVSIDWHESPPSVCVEVIAIPGPRLHLLKY